MFYRFLYSAVGGITSLKRKISDTQKQFLEKELKYLYDQEAINDVIELDEYYVTEERKHFSIMATSLSVGAVLVGIGFLTFIASNWSAMSSLTKYLIILFGVIGFYVSGWKLENAFPKTSRSLYYLGGFLYGAGIILIGQTFHLGGQTYQALLAWAIGILPLAYYLRDKAILAFVIVLLFINSMQVYMSGSFPIVVLIAIPLIYIIIHYTMNKSNTLFILNTLLLVQFLHTQLWNVGASTLTVVVIMFLLGLTLFLRPINGYKSITKISGLLIHGAYGIALTIPEIWEYAFSTDVSSIVAIIFAICYGVFIFWLINSRNVVAIIILCGIIFRFYVDISYDFLPKSLFFIIGGVLLILFGFWFEKNRKGEVILHEVKKK